MQAPGITRHRRPFLAPIWLFGTSVLLLGVLLFAFYRSFSTTTYVVVRHAEKQLGTIDDPPLASEGEARAERLARLFGTTSDKGAIAAIYVTDTRRSQQTAAALAARLRLTPVVVPARDVAAAIRQASREHRGGNVLFVAHSNTIPDILRALAGIDIPEIPDDRYEDLYVVSVPTLGPASVLRMTY
jgi:broad specificity phosphatase PhoE